MSPFRKIYLDFFAIVMALYVYFNKGIAYSFAAEGLLLIGLLMIFYNFRKLEIFLERKVIVLLGFLAISVIYIIRGIIRYPVIDVLRDSFIFNYALFVFILFFLKDDLPYLLKKIYIIYTWYPLIETILFLILSYVPNADNFKLFGDISLLHYKYGDMSIHLFVVVMFLLNGKIKLEPRFFIINSVLIIYLFLIASAYSRAGMVCFILSFIIFFFSSQNKDLKKQIYNYTRFVPLILLITVPVYLNTSVKENFQGRKVGFGQLKENVTSLVGSNNSTLEDNKVWRLVWWGKIIDYTFLGEYFTQGKGLGMSLATDDGIELADDGAGDLRSPHNFHLNILARFGVPIFCVWLYWVFLHFKLFRKKNLDSDGLMYLSIVCMFILNASFDVFLEGPMGAFPFWVFVGIFYINQMQQIYQVNTNKV